jgi:hypothetical protein
MIAGFKWKTITKAGLVNAARTNKVGQPVGLAEKTTAELRELILLLAGKGTDCEVRPFCAIRKLSGLTYASLQTLLASFSRATCLDILEEYYACPECETGCQVRRRRAI